MGCVAFLHWLKLVKLVGHFGHESIMIGYINQHIFRRFIAFSSFSHLLPSPSTLSPSASPCDFQVSIMATPATPETATLTTGAQVTTNSHQSVRLGLMKRSADAEKARIRTGALYTIFAMGFAANLLMIVCVLAQRRLRKMTSAFILHACIINIALVSFSMPWAVGLKSLDMESMCNSLGASYIVLMTASVFNLVAIVCCEVYIFGEENIGGEDAGGSVCCVLFALSLVYISSIILHLGPTIIGGNFVYDHGIGGCAFIYGQTKNYIVYIMWILIVTIAIVGTIYYLIIMYRTIQTNTPHRVTSLIRASISFSGRTGNKRLDNLIDTSLNRARVLTGITALHCLCWYPLFLLTIVDPNFRVDAYIYSAFTLLAWSNAALEPLGFLLFDRQINMGLVTWLPCFKSLPLAAQEDRPLVTDALHRPSSLQERIGCRLCYLESEAGPSHVRSQFDSITPLDTPGSGIMSCPHHVESSHTIATNFVEEV